MHRGMILGSTRFIIQQIRHLELVLFRPGTPSQRRERGQFPAVFLRAADRRLQRPAGCFEGTLLTAIHLPTYSDTTTPHFSCEVLSVSLSALPRRFHSRLSPSLSLLTSSLAPTPMTSVHAAPTKTCTSAPPRPASAGRLHWWLAHLGPSRVGVTVTGRVADRSRHHEAIAARAARPVYLQRPLRHHPLERVRFHDARGPARSGAAEQELVQLVLGVVPRRRPERAANAHPNRLLVVAILHHGDAVHRGLG